MASRTGENSRIAKSESNEANLDKFTLTMEELAMNEYEIKKITIALIDCPDPLREDEDIHELAASIAKDGLINPITVEPDGDRYRLIAGYRRMKACESLGWITIWATIRKDSNTHRLKLVENVQRKDLSIMQEAKALKALVEFEKKTHDGDINQGEIAVSIGKSDAWFSETIKLCELPQEIMDEIPSLPVSKSALATLQRVEKERLLEAWEELKASGCTLKAAREIVGKYASANVEAPAPVIEPVPVPAPPVESNPTRHPRKFSVSTIKRWSTTFSKASFADVKEDEREEFKGELEKLRKLIDEQLSKFSE